MGLLRVLADSVLCVAAWALPMEECCLAPFRRASCVVMWHWPMYFADRKEYQVHRERSDLGTAALHSESIGGLFG